MAEARRKCELCEAEATSYCPSDSAFLCRNCDAKVHNANFLVARHVRISICPRCQSLAGDRFSGVGIRPVVAGCCRGCLPEKFVGAGDEVVPAEEGVVGVEVECLSASSSCVSSTTDEPGEEAVSSRQRMPMSNGRKTVTVDGKVEGILVNWCRRMGMDARTARRVVAMAVDLLTTGSDAGKMTVLPFRVCLTTSFWVAVRVCCGGSATCQNLKRVEQISGVPAKLILATEARLARVLKRRQSRDDHEEGWAEC